MRPNCPLIAAVPIHYHAILQGGSTYKAANCDHCTCILHQRLPTNTFSILPCGQPDTRLAALLRSCWYFAATKAC